MRRTPGVGVAEGSAAGADGDGGSALGWAGTWDGAGDAVTVTGIVGVADGVVVGVAGGIAEAAGMAVATGAGVVWSVGRFCAVVHPVSIAAVTARRTMGVVRMERVLPTYVAGHEVPAPRAALARSVVE